MYLLSESSVASDLNVKSIRSARMKSCWRLIAAAFASFMLVASLGVYAQSQASPDAPTEEIRIETQVDINTADAETLALALDGVGMAKAQDIIAYREQNGRFETVDDLQKVRGIGKATLERNRSRILLAPKED